MKPILMTLLAVLALLVSSCRSPAPETPEATQPNADAVFTAAAETAMTILTEMAAVTPSPLPATATETQAPPAATLEPTTAISVTAPVAATAAPGLGQGTITTGDKAEFVSDVTVPDGTNFSPNETFTKTWRLQNAGTTTWTTAYTLIFVSGASMGGSASVPLPSEVAPGGTVDISVGLTAPADPGSYRGYWNLKNATGQIFGLGPSANEPIWVDIVVGGAAGGASGTTTPGAAATATATGSASGGALVSNVAISVDEASVTGPCPHTFTFTTQFSLSRAGTVTYGLEAGADNNAFQITVPAPVTGNLNAGDHSFTYTLEFTNSLSGWARLHVTGPADVISSPATFSLTCQA